MEARGKIVRIEGSKVYVEVKRQSACSGNCKDCSGCEEQSVVTPAMAEIPVCNGDWVLLRSEQGAVLFGMFAIFILPLLLPLTVYLIAAPWKFAWAAVCGALLVSVLLIWYLSKSRWFLSQTTPKIIERLTEEKHK